MGFLTFTPEGIICTKTTLSDWEKRVVGVMINRGDTKDQIEDWLLKRDLIILLGH